jgi:hypothetical protein
LNIHLHCLVLDGLYRITDGAPVFHEARAPSVAELQALLKPDHPAHPDVMVPWMAIDDSPAQRRQLGRNFYPSHGWWTMR